VAVPLILSAWQLSLLGSGTTNASGALRLGEHVYAKRYTSISRCLQQFQKRHFHPYSFCQIVNTTDQTHLTHRTTNARTSAASRIAAPVLSQLRRANCFVRNMEGFPTESNKTPVALILSAGSALLNSAILNFGVSMWGFPIQAISGLWVECLGGASRQSFTPSG
jgi:hypothetical protein